MARGTFFRLAERGAGDHWIQLVGRNHKQREFIASVENVVGGHRKDNSARLASNNDARDYLPWKQQLGVPPVPSASHCFTLEMVLGGSINVPLVIMAPICLLGPSQPNRRWSGSIS